MEEVFFVKSGPFLNAGYIMYSTSIFYFTFYLFFLGGGQRTPLCLRACSDATKPDVAQSSARLVSIHPQLPALSSPLSLSHESAATSGTSHLLTSDNGSQSRRRSQISRRYVDARTAFFAVLK